MNAPLQSLAPERGSSEHLAKARALRPLIDRNGPIGEAQGALTDEVIDALHAERLFAMWTPRCYGGAELLPTESLRVLEEISYADGSTGWVLMAASLSTGTGAAFISERYADEIFAGKSRTPVIAGQGAPMGKAVARDGGYVISGVWTYGSGVKHAQYLHTGAAVYEPDGKPRLDRLGNPEARIFVAPKSSFEMGGNWDVMGLCATGSIDYTSPGVFVPEGATHITDTNVPLRGGNIFRLGIRGLSTIGHTGFTMGIARRILDEIAEISKSKTNRLGRLGDSESFLEKYGQAEAKVRAARAFAMETWADIEARLVAGEGPTNRQWTLMRLALNHITWTIAEVSNFAFYAGGGVALRESTLQRCFRDMHGATQHLTSSLTILQDCARELAGLAPDKVWGFTKLIPKGDA